MPQSVDFRLYRNDPSAPMILFAPEEYKPGRFAWSVSAEDRPPSWGSISKDFDVSGAARRIKSRTQARSKAVDQRRGTARLKA